MECSVCSLRRFCVLSFDVGRLFWWLWRRFYAMATVSKRLKIILWLNSRVFFSYEKMQLFFFFFLKVKFPHFRSILTKIPYSLNIDCINFEVLNENWSKKSDLFSASSFAQIHQSKKLCPSERLNSFRTRYWFLYQFWYVQILWKKHILWKIKMKKFLAMNQSMWTEPNDCHGSDPPSVNGFVRVGGKRRATCWQSFISFSPLATLTSQLGRLLNQEKFTPTFCRRTKHLEFSKTSFRNNHGEWRISKLRANTSDVPSQPILRLCHWAWPMSV